MRAGLPDPLIELLGARWSFGAPAAGVAWLADGRAAFALADGTLALAQTRWDGAASLRPRAEGGVELVPPTGAPPPAMRVGVPGGACVGVAPESDAAIVAGADGRVVRIASDGTTRELANLLAPPVVGLGPRPSWAALNRCWRDDGATLDLPGAITALTCDPSGTTLAIGHTQGVTLWSDCVRHLPLPAAPETLAWSADGRHLAAGRSESVHLWIPPGATGQILDGYANPPLSLSFSAGFLATSGDSRVVCWSLADAPARRQLCGPPSASIVTRVACHTSRPLVAAGYQNGAVLLCQPGAPDLLFVRTAGGGALSCLAWSPDGAYLALAVASGEAAIIAFPDLLFRATPRAPARSKAA